jgi:hypothetical protein
VAQIGHRALAKGALGTLDVEAMASEGFEGVADVLQVLSPRRTVDQDVIKEQAQTDVRMVGGRRS